MAARTVHLDCVNALKEVDAGVKNRDGKTAMQMAIENNHPECADILRDKEEGI